MSWHNVPWPVTPWDEIVPGLFVGGHDMAAKREEGKFSTLYAQKVVVDKEFDLVISFFEDGHVHGPHEDVEHIEFFFNDDHYRVLNEAVKARLTVLAEYVSLALDEGKNVLIRCQAGYNRSALLAGLVLLERGMGAAEAIETIRERRSKYALHNEQFVLYLYSQEA